MNHRQLGDVGELTVATELQKRGFIVSLPFGTPKYDLVADNGEKMFRIQVKSSNSLHPRADGYYANTRVKESFYAGHEVDFFIFYVAELHVFYVIPFDKVNGGAVTVYPHRESSGSFECYRNRWDLIR